MINNDKEYVESWIAFFQDVVFSFLTTDDVKLNAIDAEDPEVGRRIKKTWFGLPYWSAYNRCALYLAMLLFCL